MNKTNMSSRNTRKGRASMAAISALLAMLGVATLSPQASSVMPMLRRVLSLEENYGVELPDGMQMGWEQVREILHVTPPGHNVLVFGLGNDSPLWHKSVANLEGRDGRVVFLEDDFVDKEAGVQRFDAITAKYSYLEAYKVHYSASINGDFEKYMAMDDGALAAELGITSQLPADLLDVIWDTIIVDTPLGCCMGPGRYQSLYTSKVLAGRQAQKGHSTHIFVEDYERKEEREFSQKVFGGSPLGVISRGKGASNGNEQAHFRVGPATKNEENSSEEWVLLLTVSEGFYDMFQNFWSAFTKLNIGNVRVSIVAEDFATLSYLTEKFVAATSEGPVVEIRRGTDLSGKNALHEETAFTYESTKYKSLVSRRANYIRNELQAAPRVIYSDIDSVWLKDPTTFLSEDDVDMWGQKDDVRAWGTYFCTGFIAFRQTKASFDFLEMWDEALLEHPQLNQPIFNDILHHHPDLLKTVTLPPQHFPNGYLYFGGAYAGDVMEDRDNVYVVHNNFIAGHENKVNRFKQFGLWSEE